MDRPKRNMRPVLRTPFAGGLTLLLGVMGSIVAPESAYAGPDQDRVTITRQHVDAPVPAWDPASKTLSILVNQDPADTRVLWLGRGWGGSTSYPIIKHLFSVPDDPQLGFLGNAGTTWLSAPQDPGPGNSPIWAGISVDGSLSGASSQFEADNYVLDLVSVNGPGRMEMFTRTSWGVRRSWSSQDLAYRTIFNPRHSHAFTTFSKPGRYEVNVAAVARDAKGKKVYTSRVTPVVWQVGGQRPDQGAIKDFRASFEQAAPQRSDGVVAQPQFTLAPKTNFQVVGDDYLTDFTFTTGNVADNGHLVVTIDGFFMNEVPVENGVASFDEMIGDSASTFQAIYIPSDATSARWASQPVEFSRLHQESVTVAEGTDVLVPEHSREPSPTLTAADQQVSSGSAELAISPLAEGGEYSVALRSDAHLNATYKLGFYANKRTDIADCTAEGTLFNGQALFTGSFNYCKDHPVIRVSILPHPYANVAPVTLTVENPDLSTAKVYPLNLPLRADNNYEIVGPSDGQQPPTSPEAPSPQPQPQPELPPIVEQPPTVQTLLRDPIELAKGHLDVRLVPSAEGGVTIAMKDDSLTAEKKSVLREPSAVTLLVPRSALMRRSEQLKDPSFDFLGPIGSQNYVLPETQADSLVWPGFSTEGIDYSAYPQGIDYEVTLADGPSQGIVSFVTTLGVGNEVNLRIHTSDPERRWIRTTESTHLHGAWIFNQPGLYRLAVRAMSGGKEIAPEKIVSFAVDRGAQPLPPVDPPQPPVAPDTEAPGATPKPEQPKAPQTQPDNEPQKTPGDKGSGKATPPPVDSSTDTSQPPQQGGASRGTGGGSGTSSPNSSRQDGRTSDTSSSRSTGANNGVNHAAAPTQSSSRSGRIVDISRPASTADTAQSSPASHGDQAQSSDVGQSAGKTTVIRRDRSQAKQDESLQSGAGDGTQSAASAATLPTVFGGYSPVTVSAILVAAIAAGAVTVLAVRKAL